MNKTLVLDMDGTFVNFYGVDGWLNDLHNENTRPYEVAKPLYDMVIFNALLNLLRGLGWRVVITTWLAKDSTKEFEDRTRKAKIEWLKKYNVEYDEIHLVRYGTTKANATRRLGGYQILVDDNAKIRQGWTLGSTIDANENILKSLADLAISA